MINNYKRLYNFPSSVSTIVHVRAKVNAWQPSTIAAVFSERVCRINKLMERGKIDRFKFSQCSHVNLF